jgi:energy-coupling factor transport system permease protein
LAHNFWRVGIVVFLILLTLACGIPWRIWKQQMGLILLLAFLTFSLGVLFSGDALQVNPQPLRPSPEMIAVQNAKPIEVAALPQPTQYRYVLLQIGL